MQDSRSSGIRRETLTWLPEADGPEKVVGCYTRYESPTSLVLNFFGNFLLRLSVTRAQV